MSRPEHQLPPEFYYNTKESFKYTNNTRNLEIQTIMARRCIQLLDLNDTGCLLLDIGCGSGLSGDVINESGYAFVGLDISEDMLNLAVKREVDGELFLSDIGQGFSFRPGIFDGAISVSVLQWLFVASKKDMVPYKRLMRFFQCLYNCLATGARAVFQFYPDSADQVEMATSAAMKSGFKTALVVDFPDSKRNRKIYLVTCAGDGDLSNLQPLTNLNELQGGEEEEDNGDFVDEEIIDEEHKISDIKMEKHQKSSKKIESSDDERKVDYISKKSKQITRHQKKNKKPKVKSKDWIMKKKERQRKQGKKVRPDSKYTGRRRKNHF